MNVIPRIVIDSLSCGYEHKGQIVPTIKDISFSVKKGCSISIMGSSGIGKTTLCRAIAGLLPLISGNVFLDGRRHTRPDNEISVVFQNYSSFPWLNVERNLVFGLKCLSLYNTTNIEHAIWLLDQVGLIKSKEKYPRELSGGMLQRLAIARSLAVHPKVLILDEPFSSLDPLSRKQLRDLVIKLQKVEQFSLILVTHDLPDAFAITKESIVLSGSGNANFIERSTSQSIDGFTTDILAAMNNYY